MKRYIMATFVVLTLLLLEINANAQRGRVYGGRPIYHSRSMVSIGIGGFWGGYYSSPRWHGYGWGPNVGVNIGVVVPPSGREVRGVPSGTEKVEINEIVYYRKGNAYYRERQGGGFELVETPIGATISRLPVGAQLRKINGKYYYERNGIFYLRQEDSNGRAAYLVVGKNGELNTDEDRSDDYSDPYDSNRQNTIVEDERQPNAIDNADAYSVRPQVGDRFENLPRNAKQVTVGGKKLFVSSNNVYYKEVKEDGQIVYEVVEVK